MDGGVSARRDPTASEAFDVNLLLNVLRNGGLARGRILGVVVAGDAFGRLIRNSKAFDASRNFTYRAIGSFSLINFLWIHAFNFVHL